MEQKLTPRFAFGPRNYRLMFIGLAVLAAGFTTMTLDSAPYGEGFLDITLGPILLAVGFGIEFWAIMARNGQPTEAAVHTVTREEVAANPIPGGATAAGPTTTVRPTYKRP